MRYLPLLLTFTVACGDDTAKPKRQKEDQEIIYDLSLGGDVGIVEADMSGVDEEDTTCSPLDCRKSELINMIQVKSEFEYALLGGFEFEPKPFEFRHDMGE